MPNKSFSIYNSEKDSAPDQADRLVIEVGKTHVASILKNKNNCISAFELFSFTESEAEDFSKLFTAIAANSKLISNSYDAADIFINNEFSVLIPIDKFEQRIAEDYIDVMFGEDLSGKMQIEHLSAVTGIINVYRIKEQLLKVLQQNFSNITLKHTWSNVIETIVSGIFASPAESIHAQFYNTSIVVAVMKDKKLQIIQSFMYEAPEDVLYALLNIAERFQLNKDRLVLQISGMIDLNFTLYTELIAYFPNVKALDANPLHLMLDIKEYPLHYFTPFFNLAL
jgi:hypothetical protein